MDTEKGIVKDSTGQARISSHERTASDLARYKRTEKETIIRPPDPATLNQQAFAGRLGGGQLYTFPPSTQHLKNESPDAYRDASWRAILSLESFKSKPIWKMAMIEGVGTCVQTALSAYFGIALVPSATETSVGPIFPVALASIGQVFLISLFIWALGPLTGGHLNP